MALTLAVVGDKREGGSELANALFSISLKRGVTSKLAGFMLAMDGESTHLAKIFCI